MSADPPPVSGWSWPAARRWARSGAMGLGGDPLGSPPALPPAGLVERLDELVGAIGDLSSARGTPVAVSWEAALAGRATLLGLHRRGQVSANGSCRLLASLDGWVALNLPRADDLDLVPALVEDAVGEPWQAVADWVGCTPTDDVVSRSRLLGLAAAGVPGPKPAAPAPPCRVARRWDSGRHPSGHRLSVVDLSALWAGPMVARILAECGAAVTRVVSTTRPDGAAGSALRDWVHPRDERRVEVDLHTTTGRERVADLLEAADVVIEGSRPRALEHLQLGPDVHRPGRPGRVWLSLTGYGRVAPGRDWVAFGDDAAVAGGVIGRDVRGRPLFCADAVADPLTGLTGAVAVLEGLAAGGGCLIDLAMDRAAAAAVATDAGAPDVAPIAVESDGRGGWMIVCGGATESVRNRPPHGRWILDRLPVPA